MQFGFTHRALKPKQEAVIEACWIVDAILIEDQGISEGADLQQTLPVGIVPREPGDFEAHDDAGAAHADVADQALKALAPDGRCAGLALIIIHDDDLLIAPSKGNCAAAKCILPLRTLDVLD